MKNSRTTVIGSLIALGLITGFTLSAHTTHANTVGDTTAPTITLGLADPKSYTGILPIASDGTVTQDARGRVVFRAELKDGESGIVGGSLSIPRGSATMLCSRTSRTFLSAAWDCKRVTSGHTCVVKVTAFDAAGNSVTKELAVTLIK